VKRYSDMMKNNIVNPRYLYMLREIEILKLLDHPLIVNFVDWFRDDENYIYLALHLSEEGSLQQRLETIKTPLNE
jgi:serine/threonine protein kinase